MSDKTDRLMGLIQEFESIGAPVEATTLMRVAYEIIVNTTQDDYVNEAIEKLISDFYEWSEEEDE